MQCEKCNLVEIKENNVLILRTTAHKRLLFYNVQLFERYIQNYIPRPNYTLCIQKNVLYTNEVIIAFDFYIGNLYLYKNISCSNGVTNYRMLTLCKIFTRMKNFLYHVHISRACACKASPKRPFDQRKSTNTGKKMKKKGKNLNNTKAC